MKNKLPAAVECEKTFLGALLLNCHFFNDFKDKLCASDFYIDEHQQIYMAMKNVYKKRDMFDPSMIADEMQCDGEYIYELANQCPSTANVKSHADIIREKSVQRQLIICVDDLSGDSAEILASYFEELACEIRLEQLTVPYVEFIIVQVNKALIDSLNNLEESHEYERP